MGWSSVCEESIASSSSSGATRNASPRAKIDPAVGGAFLLLGHRRGAAGRTHAAAVISDERNRCVPDLNNEYWYAARCAKSSTPITSRRTSGCRLEGACQLSRAARPDLRAPLRRIADLVWTAPLARAAPPARTRSKPAPGIICRRSAYPSKSCGTVTRTAGEPTRLSSSSCARTATSPGPAMNRRVTQPRSSPKPPGAKRSSPRLCAVQAVLIFFRR